MQKDPSEILFFIITTSIGLVFFAIVVINLLLVVRNRRLKHQNQLVELKSEFDQMISQTKIEVAEETMNETARDLHDDVSQVLTFAIIQLGQLNENDQVEKQKQLAAVKDSVQNSLNSIRNISKTLSKDYLNSFGIIASLERLVERINTNEFIKCDLKTDVQLLFESKAKELFLYRIIQELVTNTIKHANATSINIELNCNGNNIHLLYLDNGKGMDLSNVNTKHGLGLTNIKKRVELINGTLRIKTEPDKGFKVQINFVNNT